MAKTEIEIKLFINIFNKKEYKNFKKLLALLFAKKYFSSEKIIEIISIKVKHKYLKYLCFTLKLIMFTFKFLNFALAEQFTGATLPYLIF